MLKGVSGVLLSALRGRKATQSGTEFITYEPFVSHLKPQITETVVTETVVNESVDKGVSYVCVRVYVTV